MYVLPSIRVAIICNIGKVTTEINQAYNKRSPFGIVLNGHIATEII